VLPPTRRPVNSIPCFIPQRFAQPCLWHEIALPIQSGGVSPSLRPGQTALIGSASHAEWVTGKPFILPS